VNTSPLTEFAESRARAERELTDQRRRAVRIVAGHANDRTDFTALMSMLGLVEVDGQVPLSRRLAVYVREVAAAVGVPREATGFEVTDTATAYLGLDRRMPSRPDHDLMLVWDERLGWYIAVETSPAESPVVVAYLDGDTVPTPAAVAQFVADMVAGQDAPRFRPISPAADRTELADRMGAVCPAALP
jgi:Family of unknown function (DUF6292)